MRTIIIAIAAVAAAGPAFAQQAGGRAPNPYALLTQEQCTADKGAVWKQSETWTRQSDGKVRTSKARCAFDAKSARTILAKQLATK